MIQLKPISLNTYIGPYAIVGIAPISSEHRITGKNAAGDWWKIALQDAHREYGLQMDLRPARNGYRRR